MRLGCEDPGLCLNQDLGFGKGWIPAYAGMSGFLHTLFRGNERRFLHAFLRRNERRARAPLDQAASCSALPGSPPAPSRGPPPALLAHSMISNLPSWCSATAVQLSTQSPQLM